MSRQAKQKICTNLDHQCSKNCSFLFVQTNWVCLSGTQRFCKNDSDASLDSLTVTRVESFCEERYSNRVKWKFFSSWLEPKSPKIVSSHLLESRYHWQKWSNPNRSKYQNHARFESKSRYTVVSGHFHLFCMRKIMVYITCRKDALTCGNDRGESKKWNGNCFHKKS